MKKKKSKENTSSRRRMLKKVGIASAFLAPTIVSFNVSNLAIAGSRDAPPDAPESLNWD